MANVSKAMGIFEIPHEIISDDTGLKHVINFFKLTEKYLANVFYSTCITSNIDELTTEFNDARKYEYNPIVGFEGRGRWDYMFNIEQYFNWLLELVVKKDKITLMELCSYLNQPEVSPLIIRYVDMELNNGIFVGESVSIKPKNVSDTSIDVAVKTLKI